LFWKFEQIKSFSEGNKLDNLQKTAGVSRNQKLMNEETLFIVKKNPNLELMRKSS
jgi:hypothetical protein